MGVTILAVFAILGGCLLVTGASAGAMLRRSAHAGRHVARHTARAALHTASAVKAAAPAFPAPTRPPVDGEAEFADALSPPDPDESSPELPPLLLDQLQGEEVTDPVDVPPFPLAEPADSSVESSQERLFDGPEPPGEYRLPDRALLRRSRPQSGQPAKAAERVAETLVETLRHFGVEATMSGQVAGPRVTRYELQLAPGTKVSRVSALKDDLAYALATTEIRILAPIPGQAGGRRGGPEHRRRTSSRSATSSTSPPNGASPLSAWLGKDISGAAVSADLARMPHILIAGTTGSGKSGCINTMLCSILMRATPDQVRMILIDPKRVELGLYESIPHLLTPVVSSPKRAAAVLANVTEEMERRYERMSLAARPQPRRAQPRTARSAARRPFRICSS